MTEKERMLTGKLYDPFKVDKISFGNNFYANTSLTILDEKYWNSQLREYERDFFLTTDRIGFSKWSQNDIKLAQLLWGNPKVTRYICASGMFSKEDIRNRLDKELANEAEYGVQYWPIFELETGELIGCCGLRPYKTEIYEIGFHLRPEFWGQGYAMEAANAAICYAFKELNAKKLFAGHNPNNIASRKLLLKLGFAYIGDEFYEPTGLYHPSYELTNNEMNIRKATRQDLQAIADIYSDIHAEEEQGRVTIGWIRDIYPTYATAEMALARDDMFVAEKNGQILGTAIINQQQVDTYKDAHWQFDAPDENVMVLHTLVISPKAAGKGYGTDFVHFYEEYARSKGCAYLRMDTNEKNTQARKMYKKLGYKEIDIIPCVFNGIEGVRLVLLEKKIG